MVGKYPPEQSAFLFWAGLFAHRLPASLTPGCLLPARLAARPVARPACPALLAFVFEECFGVSITLKT